MKKFRWLAILMVFTILGITGFQLYWLKKNYDREKQSLELLTNSSFRQTLLKLQAAKMKWEAISLESDNPLDGSHPPPVMLPKRMEKRQRLDEIETAGKKEPPITVMRLMQEKMKSLRDTSGKTGITIVARHPGDTTFKRPTQFTQKINSITISSSTSDSMIPLDPEMIREISVNKEKNGDKAESIIAIGYGNKHPDSVTKGKTQPGKSVKTFKRPTPEMIGEDILERGEIKLAARNAMFKFLYSIDSISIKDSVTLKELADGYAARLKQDKMDLRFAVSRVDSAQADSLAMNEVTIGFASPVIYKLSLQNKMAYILQKLTLPITFSFFLIGITIVSFVLLYRSLLKQRKLAELKNQFISNITHELKTPIATVGVAIEALKNFNAIHDPERTKEYLDISQNELQRLGLLVDKVLKLSVFEKKEIELKKEEFDCKQLAEEITNSMKLQFDKYHAKVKLHTEGDNFIIDADKLHVTSVIYNLLDNALKYSKEDPVIDVKLASYPEYIEFSVSDNGIGIEPEYRKKIFDKFFRVPTGNKHNIKGYGLGLSYVAEVIKQHQGNVSVQSEFGKGSTFTAKIPFAGKI